MKLKNKQTGEVIETWPGALTINSGSQNYHYDSLAKLNEEWEDVSEPKIHYTITGYGEPTIITNPNGVENEWRKGIGNFFETQEEAIKAVEKLKALRKLKGLGWRTSQVLCDEDYGRATAELYTDYDVMLLGGSQKLMDTLFGVEGE